MFKRFTRLIEKKNIASLRKKLLLIIKEIFKDNSYILDIGCGNNGSLNYWEIEKKFRLLGIDIEENSVRKFNKFYEKHGFKAINSSIEKFDSRKKFDIIVVAGVIMYLKNPERILKKISKMLKGGGLLVISTTNKEYFLRRVGLVTKKPKAIAGETFVFSLLELNNLLQNCKFKIISEFGTKFLCLPYEFGADIGVVAKKSS